MRFLGLAALAVGLCSVASATRLTFDQVSGAVIADWMTTNAPVYGDRVTSAVMGDYSYGNEFGYWRVNTGGTFAGNATWTSGYGDLVNTVWAGGSSTENPNDGFVKLTADAGFTVYLQSFKTALWSTGPSPYTNIEVRNESGSLLYSSTDSNPVGGHVLHDFTASPLMGQSLTIKYGQGWWITLDDVTFSQAVPEPGTLALLGLGLPALLRRRRKG
jgi:hypothetical protein